MDLTFEEEVDILLNQETSTGAFLAQLFVAFVSLCLFCFYVYQYRQDRCLIYPIYVQGVTAVNYTLGAFIGPKIYFTIVFFENGPEAVAIGRYVSWMMTCPAILMGFFQTIGLLGPRITFTSINTMVICDLFLMAMGILGAFQRETVPKGIFISLAVLTALYMIYHTISVNLERKTAYPGSLWTWLTMTTALFLTSWGIFPLLYFIGPPVFGISSPAGDAIGHAVGDLLAKNLFGFMVWNLRYNVVYPFIESEESKTTIVPVTGDAPDLPKDKLQIQYNGPKPNAAQAKRNLSSGKVLLIEPDVGYQKLFMYLLRDTGLQCTMAFDLHQANQIIIRGRVDDFDAILINLDGLLETSDRDEIAKFKKRYSSSPYFFPVLGYSNRVEDPSGILEEEEERKFMTHCVVPHFLDEKYLGNIVRYWRKMSMLWRRADETRALEAEHSKALQLIGAEEAYGMSRQSLHSRSFRQTTPEWTDPTNNDFGSVPPVSRQPMQSFNTQSLYYQKPVDLDMNQQQRRAQAVMSRKNSVTAIIDTDHPAYKRQMEHQQEQQNEQVSFEQHMPQTHVVPQPQLQTFSSYQTTNSPSPKEQPMTPQSPGSSPDSAPAPREIEYCSAPGCSKTAQMQCGACHQRAYCGRECQVRHWREGHKQECQKLSSSHGFV